MDKCETCGDIKELITCIACRQSMICIECAANLQNASCIACRATPFEFEYEGQTIVLSPGHNSEDQANLGAFILARLADDPDITEVSPGHLTSHYGAYIDHITSEMIGKSGVARGRDVYGRRFVSARFQIECRDGSRQSLVQTFFERRSGHPFFWTSSNFKPRLFATDGGLTSQQMVFVARVMLGETLTLTSEQRCLSHLDGSQVSLDVTSDVDVEPAQGLVVAADP